MSSALKDARWQLAAEMAGDDGFDFYAADYCVKEAYLTLAQGRLDDQPQEFIDHLAAKFRSQN
ncbi:hypothetical protein SEA_HUBBS_11 [Microbacterium phage Hubbs]|nr:hypothetical protein SEA_HUBBS_11 [Microbacterium phage Hubbs]